MTVTASLVLSPWVLWALYLLVMGVYRAKLAGRLTKTALVLAAPWVVLGFVADVIVNVFVASVVFAELPREWLLTDRLQRHIEVTREGRRYRLSLWICDHLLDPFDPSGKHC